MLTSKVAETEVLKRAAAEIVQQQYKKINKGKEDFNPRELIDHPRATTFLILKDENVFPVGTITVVADEPPQELPEESDYRTEFQLVRHQFGKVALIGSFAVSETVPDLCHMKAVLALYTAVFRHSMENRLRALICVAHPDDTIYEELLAFQLIGESRQCSLVDAPGVTRCLDLQEFVSGGGQHDRCRHNRFRNRILAQVGMESRQIA